jgi:hypothetical protein
MYGAAGKKEAERETLNSIFMRRLSGGGSHPSWGPLSFFTPPCDKCGRSLHSSLLAVAPQSIHILKCSFKIHNNFYYPLIFYSIGNSSVRPEVKLFDDSKKLCKKLSMIVWKTAQI